MSKYVKVMFGTNSGAGSFQYKIGGLNIANVWNPNADNPKEFGGFKDVYKRQPYRSTFSLWTRG